MQHLRQLLQLAFGDPHVHADAHVRLQLRRDALHRRQHAHRGDLAGLPVQVVALENIAEQMRLEVFVDGGREIEQGALHRGTHQSCLIGRASRQQGVALWNRPARRWPRRIAQAALLSGLGHLHQFTQGIEASGKTGIGIQLHQHLLDLVQGQSCVEALLQRGCQASHVALRRQSGDGNEGLLAQREGVAGGGLHRGCGAGVRGRRCRGCRGRRGVQPQRQRQCRLHEAFNVRFLCIGHR